MIVSGGNPVIFNYGAYDGATGLFAAGLIYDVTNGTPTAVGAPVPMTDLNNGGYYGTFVPISGKSYLVISVIFTDGSYGTINTDRPPVSEQFDAFTSNSSLLNFNYSAYDFDNSLTILVTIKNISNGTGSTFFMTYVAAGVYFGQFQGLVGDTYLVEMTVPADATRPIGIEGMQAFPIVSSQLSQPIIATLVGQSTTSPNFAFTQGDDAVLNLVATDGKGNPIDITNATMTTLIKGINAQGNVSIPNSQHNIIDGPNGFFQVVLTEDNTDACGEGFGKDILTQIVIGSKLVWYRGINLLAVYPPVPLQ